MTRSREVRTNITADEKDLLRGLSSAKRALREYETQVERAGLSSTKSATASRGLIDQTQGLGASYAMLTAKVAVAAGAIEGARRVVMGLAGAASDLEESQNKVNVVFGKSSEVVSAFSQSTSQSLGLSKQAALDAAGAYGNMFTTMGLGQQQAADMSVRLVQLSADMASFNNQDPSEMLQKLRAGLAGEAEPLRTVGVLLSEARVKQEAYASGIAALGSELTEAEKVQARYNLILKDTTVQHGDFARTSEGLANKQRQLAAEIDNLKAKIGEGLVGPMTEAITVTNNLATAIGGLVDLAKQPIRFDIGFGEINLGSVGSAISGYFKEKTGIGIIEGARDALGAELTNRQSARDAIRNANLEGEGFTGIPNGEDLGTMARDAAFKATLARAQEIGKAREASIDPLTGLIKSADVTRTGSGSGGASTARSAASLGLIGGIMGSLPGTPGTVAQFDLASKQFSEIRAGLRGDLAELGLSMADLSARGLEGSQEFKALEERMDALNDAMNRIGLVEDLRLNSIRDTIEATRQAEQAERERQDAIRQTSNDLFMQLTRGGNLSAGAFHGAKAAAEAAARGIEGDIDAEGNFTPRVTNNYGTIHVNVQSAPGAAVVPGVRAVE